MIRLRRKGGTNEIVFDDRAFVLSEISVDVIPGSHNTSKSIGQNGATVNSTTLDARDVAITGFIIAESGGDMAYKKQLLVDMINPLFPAEIVRDNRVLGGVPVSTPAFSSDYKTSNDKLQQFVITLYCADPFWHDDHTITNTIAAWLPSFHLPLIIPETDPIIFGYRSPSLIVSLNNAGAVDTGIVIRFSALGTVTNPSLVNVNTREALKINTVMQPGDEIRVDTRFDANTITLVRNGIETNLFYALDDEQDTFMQLHPGINLIRYNADDNLDGLEVSIDQDNCYAESFEVIS